MIAMAAYFVLGVAHQFVLTIPDLFAVF